ncbi:MAG TPA: glycoside hydrolase family 16 protein, partial [Bacteroidia bacterium]|nr:glycoside hydrolase family 16 protein [Bacteroidia bacterium]
MKYFFLSLFLLNAFYSVSQPPDNDPNWQLILYDNFNSFNAGLWEKWNYSDNGSPDGEFISLAQNTNISNGKLVLTSKYESFTCPVNYQNNPTNNPNYPNPWWACNQSFYNFTTGAIESKNSLFHFGYYEAKIRMDFAPGIWPAFWLLMYPGSPIYSEIDIFEMVGLEHAVLGFNNGQEKQVDAQCSNCIFTPFLMDQYYMTTNIHGYGNPDPSKINGCNENPGLNQVNDYTQWHRYGFEWWPTRMTWYVDGIMVRSIKTPYWFDSNIPMKVIIGTGIRKKQANLNTTSYPVNMEVDEFKYYKLKSDCVPPVNQVCYNFGTHTDIAKESYSIGNFCYNTVPSDKHYYFKAKDYVEIKGEFNVPIGSSASFDAENYCYNTSVPL